MKKLKLVRLPRSNQPGKVAIVLPAGNGKRVKYTKVGQVHEMEPQYAYEAASKHKDLFEIEGEGSVDAQAKAEEEKAKAEVEKQKSAQEEKEKLKAEEAKKMAEAQAKGAAQPKK